MSAVSKTISAYEHRVGHICRGVASQIPPLLKSFPIEGRLLDDACGTGAATEEFLKVYPRARVSALDVNPSMIEAYNYVTSQSPGLASQVDDVQVGNAQQLPYSNDSFDAAIFNFGIFFLPDPIAGVRELHRTLRLGGMAAVTTYKSFGFQPILDEVQDRIKPINWLGELPIMGPWCDSSKLEGVFKEAGFASPTMHAVQAQLWGQDVQDFKSVILESFHMFVARAWTDEEKAQLTPVTSKVIDEMLAQNHQTILRQGERVGCGGEAWVAIASK